MRTSLVYPALFALPPGIALGIGVTLLTGRVAWGVAAAVSVGGLVLALVVLGTEVGEPNLEP
ncbi:hypothetical protein ACFQGE_05725 [Halomicroarcula sp. GCM10025817]|jgi:hypothetical protein|uniref:hypothetical protein n=1 Tax=Haloarcula TaxID=2237 RepID=UPI0023E8DDFA|nr:hypothetical protein [Halomicroarcula sp. SYNS111]